MARALKIVTIISGLLLLWAGLKLQIIPRWGDLPRLEHFSLSLLLENTEYSALFSESKFSLVRLGMRKKEVLALIGEPLRITTESKGKVIKLHDYRNGKWTVRNIDLPAGHEPRIDAETFFYSRQGSPTANWHIRAVTFSESGLVTEVTKIFYVD